MGNVDLIVKGIWSCSYANLHYRNIKHNNNNNNGFEQVFDLGEWYSTQFLGCATDVSEPSSKIQWFGFFFYPEKWCWFFENCTWQFIIMFTAVEVAPKSSAATVTDQANEVSISANFLICIHWVFHPIFGFDPLKCQILIEILFWNGRMSLEPKIIANSLIWKQTIPQDPSGW